MKLNNDMPKRESKMSIIYVRTIANELFDSSAYGAVDSWKWAEQHTDLNKDKLNIYRAVYTIPILGLVVLFCAILFITYLLRGSLINVPFILIVCTLGLIAVLFLILGYSYRLLLTYYLLRTGKVNIK